MGQRGSSTEAAPRADGAREDEVRAHRARCERADQDLGRPVGEERGADLGTLVRLDLNINTGVAGLVLNDPQRFNTMGDALGDDMLRAVDHLLQRRASLRALTLQGAGSVFCAGGNPFGSLGGPRSLASSARSLLDSIRGFARMRDLHVPIVCAVHGAMVGGAAAIFLQTDLRVAESDATFQHGNLSRGVCPGECIGTRCSCRC